MQKLALVTPDSDCTPLIELGPTNSSVVMRALYRNKVQFDCDHDLVAITKKESRLSATLKNTLTGEIKELISDHIFVENGTQAFDDVYQDLKPLSRNEGILDINSLSHNKVVLPLMNSNAKFDLLRIGDAVASRNLHAAIYDALRVCSLYQSSL